MTHGRQGLALLLSMALIWTSGNLAQAAGMTADVFTPPSNLPQFQLQPPARLGRLVDYFNGSSTDGKPQPLVVLIQDLHAHYGVQKNIAGLLEFLNDRLKCVGAQPRAPTLPFALAVEGATGPVDNSVLALYPDKKVRDAATDYLLREAEIMGADAFAIQHELPQVVTGVENPIFYQVNRDLFRQSLEGRTQLVDALNGIAADLATLPRSLFSQDLKAFEMQTRAYRAGEFSTPTWVARLLTMPQARTLDVKKNFPALSRFMAGSQALTPEQLQAKTSQFLTVIEAQLSAQEKTNLRVLAKANSSAAYYRYLRELIYQKALFMSVPLELAQYLEYLHTAETAEMDHVVFEAQMLAYQIELQMAQGQARDLIRVRHDIDLLKRVADLQATEPEVREFAPRLPEFLALARTLLTNHFDIPMLRRNISAALDYYVMAMTRNQPMIDNTLALLAAGGQSGGFAGTAGFPERRGVVAHKKGKRRSPPLRQSRPSGQPATPDPRPSTAVLIAGGFHTAPLTQLLRDKNISYVVLTPTVDHISDADRALYLKRLRGDYLTEEQIETAAREPSPAFRQALQLSESPLHRLTHWVGHGVAPASLALARDVLFNEKVLRLLPLVAARLHGEPLPPLASVAAPAEVVRLAMNRWPGINTYLHDLYLRMNIIHVARWVGESPTAARWMFPFAVISTTWVFGSLFQYGIPVMNLFDTWAMGVVTVFGIIYEIYAIFGVHNPVVDWALDKGAGSPFSSVAYSVDGNTQNSSGNSGQTHQADDVSNGPANGSAIPSFAPDSREFKFLLAVHLIGRGHPELARELLRLNGTSDLLGPASVNPKQSAKMAKLLDEIIKGKQRTRANYNWQSLIAEVHATAPTYFVDANIKKAMSYVRFWKEWGYLKAIATIRRALQNNAAEHASGFMKTPGRRNPLNEREQQNLAALQKEIETGIGLKKTGQQRLGDNIVYLTDADLGLTDGALQFHSTDLKSNVIAVNARLPQELRAEAIAHDGEELHWMRQQGYSQEDAHRIAAYAQAYEFGKKGTEVTPYHQWALRQMTPEALEKILEEHTQRDTERAPIYDLLGSIKVRSILASRRVPIDETFARRYDDRFAAYAGRVLRAKRAVAPVLAQAKGDLQVTRGLLRTYLRYAKIVSDNLNTEFFKAGRSNDPRAVTLAAFENPLRDAIGEIYEDPNADKRVLEAVMAGMGGPQLAQAWEPTLASVHAILALDDQMEINRKDIAQDTEALLDHLQQQALRDAEVERANATALAEQPREAPAPAASVNAAPVVAPAATVNRADPRHNFVLFRQLTADLIAGRKTLADFSDRGAWALYINTHGGSFPVISEDVDDVIDAVRRSRGEVARFKTFVEPLLPSLEILYDVYPPDAGAAEADRVLATKVRARYGATPLSPNFENELKEWARRYPPAMQTELSKKIQTIATAIQRARQRLDYLNWSEYAGHAEKALDWPPAIETPIRPVKILIPTPLRASAQKNDTFDTSGRNVREVLENLVAQYPKLEKKLLNADHQLLPVVKIYVNDEEVPAELIGTALFPAGATLSLVPAIAGGSDADKLQNSAAVSDDVTNAAELLKARSTLVFSNSVDAIDAQLVRELHGHPYVRVSLRDERKFNELRKQGYIENNTIHSRDGRLKEILRHGGTILIDYRDADPKLVEELNSLFDRDPYYQDIRPLSGSLHIVGVVTDQEVQKFSGAFFSRFARRVEWETTFPDPVARLGNEVPANAEDVELSQSPFFARDLIGTQGFDEKGNFVVTEGHLTRALRLKKPLVIRGGDWDHTDLADSIRQLLLTGYVDFNGETIPVPPDFQIIRVGTDYAAGINDKGRKQILPAQNNSRPLWVINGRTQDQLFSFTHEEGGRLHQRPGLLSQTGTRLRITEDLPDWVWHKIMHAPVALDVEVLPGVYIPPVYLSLAPASVRSALRDPQHISWDTAKDRPSLLLHAPDMTYAEAVVTESFPGRPVQVVRVSPDTRLEQLIESREITAAGADGFRFASRSRGVLEALRAGEVVILEGMESNPLLRQDLESALTDSPYFLVNGQRENLADLPGKLILASTQPVRLWYPHAETSVELPSDASQIRTILKREFPHKFDTPEKERDFERILDLQRLFASIPASASKGIDKLYPDAPNFNLSRLRLLYRYPSWTQAFENVMISDYADAPEVAAYIRTMVRLAFNQEEAGRAPGTIHGRKLQSILSRLVRSIPWSSMYWQLADTLSLDLLKELSIPTSFSPTNTESVVNFIQGALITTSTGLRQAYYRARFGDRQGVPPHVRIDRESRVGDLTEPEQENRVVEALGFARAAFLRGTPGTGKSRMARRIGERLGYAKDQVYGPVTVGPDLHEADVLSSRKFNGHHTETSDERIAHWARDQRGGLLVVDEGNLTDPAFWNFLHGAFAADPHIWINGERVNLSPQHRIIFTGNQEFVTGRQFQDLFRDFVITVPFHEFDEGFVRDRLQEYVSTSKTRREGLIDTLAQLHELFGRVGREKGFSPRDVQELADRANLLTPSDWDINQVVYLAWQQYSGIFSIDERTALEHLIIKKFGVSVADIDQDRIMRIQNEQTKDFAHHGIALVESAARMVDSISSFLNVRERRLTQPDALQGKRGMIFEGPSGRGKDIVLDQVLRSRGFVNVTDANAASYPPHQRFYHLTASLNYDQIVETINQARREGSIVILSEMNLLSSAFLEGKLNDVLTGDAAEGFALFGTINSADNFAGRESFSTALQNRVIYERLNDYTERELNQIAFQANAELPEGQRRDFDEIHHIVKAHLWIRAQITNPSLYPTTRDLVQAIKTPLPAEAAIQRIYGLLYLRKILGDRKLPSEFSLRYFEVPVPINNARVIRLIANTLLPPGMPEVKIIIDESIPPTAAGYYSSSEHAIHLRPDTITSGGWQTVLYHELSHAMFTRDVTNTIDSDLWQDLEDLRHTAAFDLHFPAARISVLTGNYERFLTIIAHLDVNALMAWMRQPNDNRLTLRQIFQYTVALYARGKIQREHVEALADLFKGVFPVNPFEVALRAHPQFRDHLDAAKAAVESVPQTFDEDEIQFLQYQANHYLGPVQQAFVTIPETYSPSRAAAASGKSLSRALEILQRKPLSIEAGSAGAEFGAISGLPSRHSISAARRQLAFQRWRLGFIGAVGIAAIGTLVWRLGEKLAPHVAASPPAQKVQSLVSHALPHLDFSFRATWIEAVAFLGIAALVGSFFNYLGQKYLVGQGKNSGVSGAHIGSGGVASRPDIADIPAWRMARFGFLTFLKELGLYPWPIKVPGQPATAAEISEPATTGEDIEAPKLQLMTVTDFGARDLGMQRLTADQRAAIDRYEDDYFREILEANRVFGSEGTLDIHAFLSDPLHGFLRSGGQPRKLPKELILIGDAFFTPFYPKLALFEFLQDLAERGVRITVVEKPGNQSGPITLTGGFSYMVRPDPDDLKAALASRKKGSYEVVDIQALEKSIEETYLYGAIKRAALEPLNDAPEDSFAEVEKDAQRIIFAKPTNQPEPVELDLDAQYDVAAHFLAAHGLPVDEQHLRRESDGTLTFSIAGANVSDLGILRRLTLISRLVVGNNPIEDFSPIQDLTHLSYLDLQRSSVKDLSFLKGSTSLDELILNDTRVDSLKPIKSLHIRRLILLNVPLKSAYGIPPTVEQLAFEEPPEDFISELHLFHFLHDLRLGRDYYDRVKDKLHAKNVARRISISSYENLSEEILPVQTDAAGHVVYEKEILDIRRFLKQHDLPETLLEFQPLNGGYGLNLSNTEIEDLTPLSGLTFLVNLDIEHTKIKDLSPMVACPRLGTIKAEHTPLTPFSAALFIYRHKRQTPSRVGPTVETTAHHLHDFDAEWRTLLKLALQSMVSGVKSWMIHQSKERRFGHLSVEQQAKYARAYLAERFPADPEKLEGAVTIGLSGPILSIDLSAFQMSQDDLEFLRYMKDLEELDLADNQRIVDLEPLQHLEKLKRLNLARTQIDSLTPLQNLKRLTNLNIVDTPVNNLKPLISLASSLRGLTLGETKKGFLAQAISDFSPLIQLRALETLDISIRPHEDPLDPDLENLAQGELAPIGQMTWLKRLTIRNSSASNLDLKWYTNLKQLEHLRFDTAKNPQAVGALTALRQLQLKSARGSHLPIGLLPNLTDLTFDTGGVSLEDILAAPSLRVVRFLGGAAKVWNVTAAAILLRSHPNRENLQIFYSNDLTHNLNISSIDAQIQRVKDEKVAGQPVAQGRQLVRRLISDLKKADSQSNVKQRFADEGDAAVYDSAIQGGMAVRSWWWLPFSGLETARLFLLVHQNALGWHLNPVTLAAVALLSLITLHLPQYLTKVNGRRTSVMESNPFLMVAIVEMLAVFAAVAFPMVAGWVIGSAIAIHYAINIYSVYHQERLTPPLAGQKAPEQKPWKRDPFFQDLHRIEANYSGFLSPEDERGYVLKRMGARGINEDALFNQLQRREEEFKAAAAQVNRQTTAGFIIVSAPLPDGVDSFRVPVTPYETPILVVNAQLPSAYIADVIELNQFMSQAYADHEIKEHIYRRAWARYSVSHAADANLPAYVQYQLSKLTPEQLVALIQENEDERSYHNDEWTLHQFTPEEREAIKRFEERIREHARRLLPDGTVIPHVVSTRKTLNDWLLSSNAKHYYDARDYSQHVQALVHEMGGRDIVLQELESLLLGINTREPQRGIGVRHEAIHLIAALGGLEALQLLIRYHHANGYKGAFHAFDATTAGTLAFKLAQEIARTSNIDLQIDREVSYQTLDQIRIVLDVIQDMGPLLLKAEKPIALNLKSIDGNAFGNARIDETVGAAAVGQTQFADYSNQDEWKRYTKMRQTIAHELLHKLSTVNDRTGNDLVFPVANWIALLELHGMATLQDGQREVSARDYLDVSIHGFETVKSRIRTLAARDISIQRNQPKFVYRQDPHEILTWHATGVPKGSDGVPFGLPGKEVDTYALLQKSLLRQAPFLFQFDASTGRWVREFLPPLTVWLGAAHYEELLPDDSGLIRLKTGGQTLVVDPFWRKAWYEGSESFEVLDKPVITFGREGDVQADSSDTTVSRIHGRLLLDQTQGTLTVLNGNEDRASANNGIEPLTPRVNRTPKSFLQRFGLTRSTVQGGMAIRSWWWLPISGAETARLFFLMHQQAFGWHFNPAILLLITLGSLVAIHLHQVFIKMNGQQWTTVMQAKPFWIVAGAELLAVLIGAMAGPVAGTIAVAGAIAVHYAVNIRVFHLANPWFDRHYLAQKRGFGFLAKLPGGKPVVSSADTVDGIPLAEASASLAQRDLVDVQTAFERVKLNAFHTAA